MSIQLPDARQLSDEALQALRLRALRGIELGYSELELADLLGVCHETISRWWTAVTRSERHGNEVRLRAGADDTPFVSFTVEHAPGTGEVIWTVTDCAVMADWVGTKPSFFVEQNHDGTCTIDFRHVGLSPALECFDHQPGVVFRLQAADVEEVSVRLQSQPVQRLPLLGRLVL